MTNVFGTFSDTEKTTTLKRQLRYRSYRYRVTYTRFIHHLSPFMAKHVLKNLMLDTFDYCRKES